MQRLSAARLCLQEGLESPVLFTKHTALCPLLSDWQNYHRNQTVTTPKHTHPHAERTNITVRCVISQAQHLACEILTPTVLRMWGQQLGSCTNNTGGNLIPWCILKAFDELTGNLGYAKWNEHDDQNIISSCVERGAHPGTEAG